MSYYKDDIIHFWIEDGILKSEFYNPITLDANYMKEMIKIRHQLSNGEKQYWLYDFRKIENITTECRKYAEKYGQEYLHATAAIVNSHLTKFLVNIFNKINNPKIPFKAFQNEKEAIDWLKGIKQKNEEKS